jgi:hypothetical protein
LETKSWIHRLGIVWGVFMVIIWYLLLGEKETTPHEKLMNHILHYYQPALWMMDWFLSCPIMFWKRDWLLYMPTALSAGLIYAVGKYHLGYQIYPMFEGYQLAIDGLIDARSFMDNPLAGLLYVLCVEIMASFSAYIIALFFVVKWATNWLHEKLAVAKWNAAMVQYLESTPEGREHMRGRSPRR